MTVPSSDHDFCLCSTGIRLYSSHFPTKTFMKMPYLPAGTLTAVICLESSPLQEENLRKYADLRKRFRVAGRFFSIILNLFGLNFNQAQKCESNSSQLVRFCVFYIHPFFF